jgi:hypothetical protein
LEACGPGRPAVRPSALRGPSLGGMGIPASRVEAGHLSIPRSALIQPSHLLERESEPRGRGIWQPWGGWVLPRCGRGEPGERLEGQPTQTVEENRRPSLEYLAERRLEAGDLRGVPLARSGPRGGNRLIEASEVAGTASARNRGFCRIRADAEHRETARCLSLAKLARWRPTSRPVGSCLSGVPRSIEAMAVEMGVDSASGEPDRMPGKRAARPARATASGASAGWSPKNPSRSGAPLASSPASPSAGWDEGNGSAQPRRETINMPGRLGTAALEHRRTRTSRRWLARFSRVGGETPSGRRPCGTMAGRRRSAPAQGAE